MSYTISAKRRNEIRKLYKQTGTKIGKPLTAYAWPGGYPIFYLAADGETLHPKCAQKFVYLDSHERERIIAGDVNWEDEDMTCAECNKKIESAYGETKENPPSKLPKGFYFKQGPDFTKRVLDPNGYSFAVGSSQAEAIAATWKRIKEGGADYLKAGRFGIAKIKRQAMKNPPRTSHTTRKLAAAHDYSGIMNVRKWSAMAKAAGMSQENISKVFQMVRVALVEAKGNNSLAVKWLNDYAAKIGQHSPNGKNVFSVRARAAAHFIRALGKVLTNPAESCEVCGKTGAAAKACTFEKACSCWRGTPCKSRSLRRDRSKDLKCPYCGGYGHDLPYNCP